MESKYNRILRTAWPPEPNPAAMPMNSRAAQFAPFSALTGYEDVIGEAGRLTQGPVFLTEESLLALNGTLNAIREHLDRQPKVKMTVFYDDEKKEGGSFRQVEGNVKKIDRYEGVLLLTDGQKVPFSKIVEIEEASTTDE